MLFRWAAVLGAALFCLTACTSEAPLGSKSRPINIGLVPGQNPKTLEVNGRHLADFLEKEIGLKFQVHVPVSFIAVVEALGTKRIDMAMMNTFGYLLAHEKHGARVRLIGLFKGTDEYYGQIIAHVDGPKTLEQLNGKKVAFVDPASTSGHLMAIRLFKERGIKPQDVVFAGRHDTVAMMVYQKRVDAGATYHALPDNGEPQDARKLIAPQYPDVFKKVRILARTGPIPNDPIVFRKDFPIEIQEQVVVALRKYVKTPEGLKALDDLYHMSDFRDATDADYENVRKMLLEAGKSASDFIK
ncbi:MAG: phosphate/phosphite/phosphonate ABC transporter substrate-binding protein [Bdellovibrionaceae bacterium]|nr:phosphate/phosphite/phosphonate ABC transporter substrate-binding protein [Pseudobdellovibrionaceae bacterium]